MDRSQAAKSLRVISRAWGRKQTGYVFFPYIDREEQARTGSRRAGFHEGPAFKWPQDRERILTHLVNNSKHDLYWSCSLFEYPMRREDVAMDEHALWADLDDADPTLIDPEYQPTVAWESSPGRYQALWVAASGDFQGASWPGNENQRMTYMVGADPSGWDTVQLLRVPGTSNHKPEYKDKKGNYPKGKILWADGPTYQPGDFADLPEVAGAGAQLNDALEQDIDGVDRHEVIARIRLKLNRRAREMLTAREVSGDRSEQLWYLIRCLADAGCSVAEIVAVVRESVWNKFRERGDELKRLIIEASKAIAQRSDETIQALEEDEIERDAPERLGFLLQHIKKPKYVIDRVLSEGACGFIAGEPKSYKSWVGLDMALSVATGASFLGHFRVVNPGPVLYIQEEDPPTTLKARSGKIWVSKSTDKIVLEPSPDFPDVLWLPPDKEEEFDPDVNAYIQKGVTISDEAWQVWLDETLAAGMNGEPYRLMIIDTLMMTAGDVEENRSQEMTNKIFKPLKVLSRKHNVAIQVIHHMGKADRSRAGQRLLGSVANHAWAEDSIYLSRSGLADLRVELESKVSPGGIYRMGNINNFEWTPHIGPWRPDEDEQGNPVSGGPSGAPRGNNGRRLNPDQTKLKTLLEEAGPQGVTNMQVADMLGITRSTAAKRMQRLATYIDIDAKATETGSTRWVMSE